MNRWFVIILSLVAFFIFSSTGISLPEKLYISAKNAKLKSERKASSDTVSPLKIGAELSVISFENKWYNVKTTDGKTGWIYRGKVSENKPETSEEDDKKGGLGGLLDNIADSNIQANASDTSRSIRGLSPEAEEYSNQTGKPKECRAALDSVLELEVNDAEIENFLMHYKIGEYAE